VEKNKIDDFDFSSVKIAVIGDCMLDIYYYGSVDRISPEAPVPIFKMNNDEPEYRLGGACNTALNLSKLGVQTTLYGFTGNDLNGAYINTYLAENNIDNRLIKLKHFPTITKSRYFSSNQQVIRIDEENINNDVYDRKKQNELIDDLLKNMSDYDAFIISDYNKGALYHPVLETILNCCYGELPIFVDPKINNWENYRNAFCITPNWKEFKHACHDQNLNKNEIDIIKECASRQCVKHNIEFVLVTMGSDGMILIDKNGDKIRISSQVEEIYDVSGAGDTVIAVFAAACIKEYPMKIAMQLATLGAKIVIGKLGTYAITNSELQLELKKMKFGKDGYCGII